MLKKKILLSDDAELQHVLENSFFRRIGYSLVVAESGERAFEMLEEQDPVLAILTLDGPNWQGDTICRRAKGDAILRSTPIILVVPAGCEEAENCCRAAGCDDILYRPIDGQHLLAVACRLLNIVERGAPRITTDYPVLFGKETQKLRPSRALNLNPGGLFIEAERLFPVDTMLSLEFTLPGRTAVIRAKGRVAWVNHPEWVKTSSLPSGMGIQFLNLADDAVEVLRDFVEKASRGCQEISAPLHACR